MLTESFFASTLNTEKQSNSVTLGIHLHDYQPIVALKHTFKKSSIRPNCLAIHPTHVLAAQADKAVVHVYNREKNSQESIVPFPERIHSIALAGESDGAGVLILGTETGRLILWELATGRQVSTPQHHLQQTTCLAVDPTSNFLLSGSPDSTIHVWSVPGLLSFSASNSNDIGPDAAFSPLRSLSNHRAAITAIITGHSFSRNNIAISASKDNTCIVWEYSSGELLHTFLLAASPLCLALDPADRAAYAGCDDGSIQFIDFYSEAGLTQQLRKPETSSAPTQPPSNASWPALSQPGAPVLCLQVSYDGTSALSGGEDGKIHTWDLGAGRCALQLAEFGAPVTNLHLLKPTGFSKNTKPAVKIHNVVKPRYESFTNDNHNSAGTVPSNYTFTAQFTATLATGASSGGDSFHEALCHPSFPPTVLDEALVDFMAWHNQAKAGSNSSDYGELRARNTSLESQLEAALVDIQAREKEDGRRQKDEVVRAEKKKRRRLRRIDVAEIARKKEMGEKIDDEDKEIGDNIKEDGDLSSSTDELSDGR